MQFIRRWRKYLWIALAAAASGFVAASAVSAWWFTAAKHSPIGPVPADFGGPVEAVSFPAREDQVGLSGWYAPCPGARLAVVLLHGYTSNRLSMLPLARWLHTQGFAVLLYDARGCGASGGDKISAGWYETHDLLGALDFLRNRGFSEFGCIGESQGGATIALAAPRLNGVRWAVLESTYPTLRNALARRFRIYAGLTSWLAGCLMLPFAEWRLGVDVDSISPRDAAAGFRCPVLVMSGELDRRTEPEDARELYDRVPTPKDVWIVPGAAHEDLLKFAPAEYERRLRAFITSHSD